MASRRESLEQLRAPLLVDDVPSALWVGLLPVGFTVVVWSWVYSRALVSLLGIAGGLIGAAGPFWTMNGI